VPFNTGKKYNFDKLLKSRNPWTEMPLISEFKIGENGCNPRI